MLSVLGSGESLQADEAADALKVLNNMLGSWSAEGGLVFHTAQETFTPTGAVSYTIGTGGDFNTQRPLRIVSAFISDGSADTPMQQIGVTEYNDIANKDIVGRSYSFYYDNNYPLARIFFYPIPSGTYTVTLYSIKPLSSFASQTTAYNFPSEYEDAIVKNLMVNLAPYYGVEPTPNQLRLARDSKNIILTNNSANQSNQSPVDPTLVRYYDGLFNVYTGRYE